MDYLTKSIPLEVKATGDGGKFTGYGSVFNVVDKGGDIIVPGAFSASLARWKASGRNVPMLWQHDTGEPIGHWPDLKEDDHGLLGTDAELWLDDAPYARLAQKGMKTKTITGLSIGYRVKRFSKDTATSVYTLQELDLVEISVVTNPMNDQARVSDVKSMIEAGKLPSLPEFEGFLREAGGFSKSQAAAIAGGGLVKLLSRGEPAGDTGAILAALSGFKL